MSDKEHIFKIDSLNCWGFHPNVKRISENRPQRMQNIVHFHQLCYAHYVQRASRYAKWANGKIQKIHLSLVQKLVCEFWVYVHIKHIHSRCIEQNLKQMKQRNWEENFEVLQFKQATCFVKTQTVGKSRLDLLGC